MAIIKHESYIKFDKDDIHKCIIDSNITNDFLLLTIIYLKKELIIITI